MNQSTLCPKCGQTVRVDSATIAGQPVRCPRCATTFLLFDGPTAAAGRRRQGLAIASLVLGIGSLLLFWTLLPSVLAVVFGHIAHGRAKKTPAKYAGGGLAIAGFVLGYVSLLLAVFIVTAVVLPALSAGRHRARAGNSNHLKEIGIAFRVWGDEHNGQYPFNISQAQGGTRELCHPDAGGVEQNPAPTFMVMSNELSSPRLLVCPNDPARHPAANFASLTADNISYQLHTGPKVSPEHPQEILLEDPLNGFVLLCNGNVKPVRSHHPGN